jgi:hypothetical protein
VPSSVAALLGDGAATRYSPAQALAALLDCFARLPPAERLRLVEQYVRHTRLLADHPADRPEKWCHTPGL